MIVADTNLITYFLLPGDHSTEAAAVFQKDPEWAAPLLWRSEFRNVLAHYLRRSALSLEQALDLMADAEMLLLGREYSLPSEPVMRLAARSPCSAYDCEFIALADELDVSLVTRDTQILASFSGRAVSPITFMK